MNHFRPGDHVVVTPQPTAAIAGRSAFIPDRTPGAPSRLIRTGGRRGTGIGIIISITTGTQLRAAGPLGLGEVLLLVWIALSLYQMTRTQVVDHEQRPVNHFWAVLVPVLMIGPVWAGAIGRVSSTAPRDALAMVLMASFCFVTATHLSNEERERLALTYCVCTTSVFLALFLVPQLAAAVGVNPYYASTRFVGWATNPNQVAIDLIWVPFVLFRAARTRVGTTRLALLTLVFGSLTIGWASDSDSLRLGWGFAALVVGLRFVFGPERSAISRQIATGIMIGGLGLCSLQIPSFAKSIGSYFDSLRFQQGTDDGGGRGRLQRNAIIAWTYSPFIGLGPGEYSGVEKPFDKGEAHNSALDLLTKAGAVGLVALFVLIRKAWRKAVIDGWPAVGALSAFIMFTTGHNVLRHPASWLLLVLLTGLPRAAGALRTDHRPVTSLRLR